MPPTRRLELAAFASACLVIVALKVAGIWPPTWLETIGTLTGVACVRLVVRRHIGNFPVGIVSCAAYFVFLFRDGLYGDAGLQIVYIALNVHGWIVWASSPQSGPVVVRRVPRWEAVALAAFLPAGTFGLLQFLTAVSGAAPFLDALTTTLSLIAQWMLNRKFIESWLVWIVADVIYVYLYATRGMYLTVGLYAVFLGMCVAGLIEWRASIQLLDDDLAELDRPPVGE